MTISKIEIENFKLFNNQTFKFNDNFNLIVGINGSGKTSLLRAISVALGGWANAYIKSDKNLRPIEDTEIREIQIDNSFDKTKLTSITVHGIANIVDNYSKSKNGIVTWTRKREEGDTQTLTSCSIQYERPYYGDYSALFPLKLHNLGKNILNYIDNGKTFNLPMIAFYECDRLWLAKNELNLEDTAKLKHSRFDPYKDCFHTGADHQAIGEWLLKHELVSMQEGTESPVLKSIQKAAIAALEDCIGIRFNFKASRVMVEFKDNIIIPFEHLSDGQRTILGLFCDIARRAAILNPHLEAEESLKLKGVVLIDELDLHLHPRWQRKIIDDLNSVFPNIQFITTTHSPHIIQSAKPNEIIVLEKSNNEVQQKELADNEFGFKGWTVEEILTDIMGMKDTRTDVFHKTIQQFEKAIEAEDYQLSKTTYEELDKLLHPNNHLRKLLKFDLISIKDS